MVPGLVSGGAQQISIAIATILSSLQDQAVSYLSYADRLYQLPLSLVGAAIGVVLLPVLARSIRGGREAEAMAAFNRSLEFGLLLILPATVGLIIAAEPIVRVVYERGAFTADATHQHRAGADGDLASACRPIVLNKTLQPGFFARGDTVTPFRYSIITIVTDMTICIAFFFLLRRWGVGFVGIALGTGIASWLNCTLLYRTLSKRGFLVLDQRLKRNLPRFVARHHRDGGRADRRAASAAAMAGRNAVAPDRRARRCWSARRPRSISCWCSPPAPTPWPISSATRCGGKCTLHCHPGLEPGSILPSHERLIDGSRVKPGMTV